jgi:CDP-4-dehydro-6-deoxyglucose reductase, E1
VLKNEKQLRENIIELTSIYFSEFHVEKTFVPGEDYVRYSGRVFDQEEGKSLVSAALDFWLTAGDYAKELERKLAKYFGLRNTLLTNSGSSANLLAMSALTSEKLGNRRLIKGDEVITVAAGFPTTVNPIYQNNLVPVYCDVELGSYNIDLKDLEKAISNKTKAIFMAHTLGNPFDLDAIIEFAQEHKLWVIEDNCDALGSTWRGNLTGTFGDLSTQSFYPPHHITLGEGGAVNTNKPVLKTIVESFRDWGRDCWCESGKDNTCGKRFEWELGEMPKGYDHKYIYSHIGYNLKVTDLQAAIGVTQMDKLPRFTQARKANHKFYMEKLKKYEEFFILPQRAEQADPSWFGFIITLKENTPFTRNQIVQHLEESKVATRMLFGGNLTKQPAYIGKKCRIVSGLANTNFIMKNSFWIGVYPGITEEMRSYVVEVFDSFMKQF